MHVELLDTEMDHNSTSPNTENSGEGGAYSVLCSWGTAIITAINIFLYLFVYNRYGLPVFLHLLWSGINLSSLCCLVACCWFGNWRYRPSNHPIQTTHFNHDGPVIGSRKTRWICSPRCYIPTKSANRSNLQKERH